MYIYMYISLLGQTTKLCQSRFCPISPSGSFLHPYPLFKMENNLKKIFQFQSQAIFRLSTPRFEVGKYRVTGEQCSC